MLNYEVDPAALMPFVPPGVELDVWQGKALASIVGFEFADARVLGVPIPFHRNFEEINLRFYVRRWAADGWRRGVVFVRELVPLPAVALLARGLYGEPYRVRPMDRLFRHHPVPPESPSSTTREAAATTVRYSWRQDGTWNRVEATADTTRDPRQPEPGSEEEFITDHAYGYGSHRGKTIEYVVEHPIWRYWHSSEAKFVCNDAALHTLYGGALVPYLQSPRSAFLVDGSPVIVRRPRAIWG